MKALQERILAEGQNLGSGILKIDSLLNHQLYPELMMQMGEEIAKLFAGVKIDRILTAEISGIAPSLMAGYILKVPVVYARRPSRSRWQAPCFWKLHPATPKAARLICWCRRSFYVPVKTS